MTLRKSLFLLILLAFLAACKPGTGRNLVPPPPSEKLPAGMPHIEFEPTMTIEKIPAVYTRTSPPPSSPQLDLTPYSGPIGTNHTLTLADYSPYESVTIEIYFDGSGELIFSSTTTVDERGNGSFQFYTEPRDAPGRYTVYATGGSSFRSLSVGFSIES